MVNVVNLMKLQLLHRLTYRRTNQGNLHVRGYKEEGAITTPFDMTVLNDMDRFHLAMDVVERVPTLRADGADSLAEHERYIRQEGVDLPSIRDWRWGD
ncbi:Xylulose-5-phosphate phosphoketolase [Planctomycetes bacterium Pla86]|uniref:Xylulose-5-phosphate phosphoketolase n=1 Tax=Engelhardtia mirabilis TaxID=2528011 RepID=A0A518BFY5_9BACT|nr:Xylulose-5-phosphate phosphoketolase [Planctomycetes bacterium Pla133]QDV00211.1 Xylulose-5-phosphate phosphoketolase [Planctomycetes bacterium Pla86]